MGSGLSATMTWQSARSLNAALELLQDELRTSVVWLEKLATLTGTCFISSVEILSRYSLLGQIGYPNLFQGLAQIHVKIGLRTQPVVAMLLRTDSDDANSTRVRLSSSTSPS